MRSARLDREKLIPALKKPVTGTRKATFHDNILTTGNKATKQIITVPLAGKQKQMGATRHTFHVKDFSPLPDQETIKKCEDLETQQDEPTDSNQIYHPGGDVNERDSITSRSEKIMQLKMQWQEKIGKFESMKFELNERQRTILELYASLHNTHQKLNALGHKSSLPSAEDLRVMNVAKMTPDQLLQLCSDAKRQQNDKQLLPNNNPLNLDIKKLNSMPNKLIALCEETLMKRKEIIDWFDTLNTQEKGCTRSSLTKKIKEFNAENEMLNCSLDNVKSEFLKELNDIFDFLRVCVKDTIALQLRTEELNCALSDINSKNSDLRKQIYNADQCRSQNNRSRIMELENLLKEEKQRKTMVRDRLTRAEGQVKIGEERSVQLEAALNQARSHNRNLERTVQQLNDQNNRLQLEFDKELGKLNQSIKENTTHLEEIADAREKLQTEKEDLEKRLEELSNNYNESLDLMKEEQSRNVEKIIEFEKKYNEEIEERKKCDTQIELLCTQLVETELRYKDTAALVQEQKLLLSKTNTLENELRSLKMELDKRNSEIEDYKQSLTKQNDAVKEIEENLNEALASEEKLKCVLNDKEKTISELKTRQKSLEKQLQNRDFKMKQYEEQIFSLKTQAEELQERWSAIENLHLLPDMVNNQNTKLEEITQQNSEMAEELEKKNSEIEHNLNTIKEQEKILKEKKDLIKILTDKEEEHANIIKLLKNHIETKAHMDSEMNRQLVEKNAEIDTLLNNLEARKQQINELEKIILTLEDQVQKATLQKRKDEENLRVLKKQIAKYEACRLENKTDIENQPDNLDNLIKILEEELSSPIEPQLHRDQGYYMNNKNRYNNKKQMPNHVFFQETVHSDHFKDHHEALPTKIEMGNFVKKTYMPTKTDLPEINDFGCGKGVFNRNVAKCIPFRDYEPVHTPPQLLIKDSNIYEPFDNLNHAENRNLARNVQCLISNHLKEEKKRKMFRLAGHRL
ncbi:uncharacterized protein [Epargyreus clarus]